jgi:hypothetical protein
MLRICAAVAILCSIGSGAALAYHQVGAGVDRCRRWTADRRDVTGPAALQDEQWVLGFLTGVGFAGSEQDDPLNGVTAETVWTWVDLYCAQHPAEKFVQAARAYAKGHRH